MRTPSGQPRDRPGHEAFRNLHCRSRAQSVPSPFRCPPRPSLLVQEHIVRVRMLQERMVDERMVEERMVEERMVEERMVEERMAQSQGVQPRVPPKEQSGHASCPS